MQGFEQIRSIMKLAPILATSGVNARMEEDAPFARRVAALVRRFSEDDWGDMDAEDMDTNRTMARSLRSGGGGTVMGSYGRGKDKVWIIQNEESTTVLFPDEY